MLQPVVQTFRCFGRSICVRQYSIQCSRGELSSLTLHRKPKHSLFFKRQFHHPTEKNVIMSPLPDITVPNCVLNDFIWQGLDKWADKTAVVCGITGKGFTYAQAYKMTTAFAACLRNKLKIRDGDCVAVMLPNSPEFPLATIGAIQAGCVVTTVNPIYLAEEVEIQLRDSGAKVMITTAETYDVVQAAIKKLGRPIPVIVAACHHDLPCPEGAIKFAEFAENFSEDTSCLKEVRRHSDDVVFLPYSSGTTGMPKGVELTHRNIAANCTQMLAGKITIIYPTTDTFQDVSICVLPFFHIYGLTVTLLSKLALGAKIVTLPKFTPDYFLNAQAKYKGSVLFLVPPIVLFLGSYEGVNYTHLDSIRTVMSGAAPLAPSDIDRFLQRTRKNVAFMQGYGLTETSPVIMMQERGSTNYASVGGTTPNTEAKIVDLEDNSNVLGPNQVGELWVRGPQVMKGYHNNQVATDDIFRPGGWMRTGDLAYYDENHAFYITERLKELIKVKGYQVAPAELEGILRSHPELADAAVIGVPHAKHGETPKAFVVKKDGLSPTSESIMQFVAEKVASYKKLGDLQFVDSIPKNAAGKILRREVKKKYA